MRQSENQPRTPAELQRLEEIRAKDNEEYRAKYGEPGTPENAAALARAVLVECERLNREGKIEAADALEVLAIRYLKHEAELRRKLLADERAGLPVPAPLPPPVTWH